MTNTTRAFSGSNRLLGNGFTAYADLTITACAIEVTAAAAAASVADVAVYAATRTAQGGYVPGARLAILATGLPVDSLGLKSATGLSVSLQRGRAYFLAVSSSGSPTLRASRMGCPGMHSWNGGTGTQASVPILLANASHPPPDPAPTMSLSASGTGLVEHMVHLQWSEV